MVAGHRQMQASNVGIVATLDLTDPSPGDVRRVVILLIAGDLATSTADATGHIEVEAELLAIAKLWNRHLFPRGRARLELFESIHDRSRGGRGLHGTIRQELFNGYEGVHAPPIAGPVPSISFWGDYLKSFIYNSLRLMIKGRSRRCATDSWTSRHLCRVRASRTQERPGSRVDPSLQERRQGSEEEC